MSKPGCMGRFAVALFLGVSSPALAQNLPNAGSIGQRLPGELVSAGLVRQQGTVISPRINPEITDQAPVRVSPRNQFFVDALEIIFDQLNQAIFLFSNIIRAQLGGTPLLPTTLGTLPPPTSTPSETGPGTAPDIGAGGEENGATTTDPGVSGQGDATSTGQKNGARAGQRTRRTRRSPGRLEARSQLRSAAKAAKR